MIPMFIPRQTYLCLWEGEEPEIFISEYHQYSPLILLLNETTYGKARGLVERHQRLEVEKADISKELKQIEKELEELA